MVFHDEEDGIGLHGARLLTNAGSPADLAKVAAVLGLLELDFTNPAKPVLFVAKSTTPGDWVKPLAAGAGGGAAIDFYLPDVNAPQEAIINGIEVLDFATFNDENEIFAILPVPTDFVSGTQISLECGQYATEATTLLVLFSTETALLRPGVTDITSLGGTHPSGNAAKTVQAGASILDDIGQLVLTTGAGVISGTTVLPGDSLLIKLFRDTSVEDAGAGSAAADARLLRRSFKPNFIG